MAKCLVFLGLISMVLMDIVLSVQVVIEAETTPLNFPKHFRSNASNKQTVYLHQGNSVAYNFCLIKSSIVTINNIRTSNDGDSDTLKVYINGIYLKTFHSQAGSNYGQNWNVFSSSGTIGTLSLPAGKHNVTIDVTASDTYGVEIDVLEFSVNDDEVTNATFTCQLQCITDPPVVTAKPGLIQGKAVQRSYPTQCAEEDNVDVALFNKGVKEFEITASPPLYSTTRNDRHENTENCPFLTPLYWIYNDVVVSASTPDQTSNTSQIHFWEESQTKVQMITTFTLKGRKNGYIDSEIGSKVFLKLETPVDPCLVTIQYLHRNGNLISLPQLTFNSTTYAHEWNIPDFTWKEDVTNVMFVHFESNSPQTINEFRMERRYMGPDQVITIYQSSTIKVEAIKIDFWWKAPESMEIVIATTQQTWKNIAYFRISNLQANGFAQIFVLYQDGNIRLLYPIPSQFDWIPFGTSVILGQTKTDDFRPSVSISRVEVNPNDLSMVVKYNDNSKVLLDLITSTTTTKLRVYGLNFKKDRETHPFATFRSMYVETGNSDADNIVSDQSTTKRILGGSWTQLNGTTFLLYRRCESLHLTRSPDIKIEITRT